MIMLVYIGLILQLFTFLAAVAAVWCVAGISQTLTLILFRVKDQHVEIRGDMKSARDTRGARSKRLAKLVEEATGEIKWIRSLAFAFAPRYDVGNDDRKTIEMSASAAQLAQSMQATEDPRPRAEPPATVRGGSAFADAVEGREKDDAARSSVTVAKATVSEQPHSGTIVD